jgi:hypothetical protein
MYPNWEQRPDPIAQTLNGCLWVIIILAVFGAITVAMPIAYILVMITLGR